MRSKNRTTIVAEIGLNHNGSMSLARESIMRAADAGVDSVKFQNYSTEDFITDRNLQLKYWSKGVELSESQFDLFKRCELTVDNLGYLKEICDSAGVLFHSTPTSINGVRDLCNIGCEVLKNGSDYLTNLELIKAMGESGCDTVISTGMATLAEIDDAVRVFRATGNQKLTLLHCTSSYPTQPDEVNLSRIAVLRDAFGVDVGFSDHTVGSTAAIAATVLGATWIEKHFTVSKDLPGPDHWFSVNEAELRDLVIAVRNAEQLVGSTVIGPTFHEEASRVNFRLSCVASRNLTVGQVVTRSDVLFHRPGDGIPPNQAESLIGLRVVCPITKGQKFERDQFKAQ